MHIHPFLLLLLLLACYLRYKYSMNFSDRYKILNILLIRYDKYIVIHQLLES